jgi:hypothetical protein
MTTSHRQAIITEFATGHTVFQSWDQSTVGRIAGRARRAFKRWALRTRRLLRGSHSQDVGLIYGVISREHSEPSRVAMRSAMRTADQQSQRYSRPRAPGLAADLAELGRVLRSLVDPYRPELYYMRGPGPKWHAQHDPPPAIVDASAVPMLHG